MKQQLLDSEPAVCVSAALFSAHWEKERVQSILNEAGPQLTYHLIAFVKAVISLVRRAMKSER